MINLVTQRVLRRTNLSLPVQFVGRKKQNGDTKSSSQKWTLSTSSSSASSLASLLDKHQALVFPYMCVSAPFQFLPLKCRMQYVTTWLYSCSGTRWCVQNCARHISLAVLVSDSGMSPGLYNPRMCPVYLRSRKSGVTQDVVPINAGMGNFI